MTNFLHITIIFVLITEIMIILIMDVENKIYAIVVSCKSKIAALVAKLQFH